MLEWFVLRTKWQQEQRAERELQQQRIRTLLPMARTEYRRASDGLLCARVEPLFKRYMFVQIHWARRFPVLNTRGVTGFVGYFEGMDKAPSVPKAVMQELKLRLEDVLGRDVLVLSRLKELEPGMMARILFGPFRDHVAPVQAINGSRVKVLLDVLGIQVPQHFEKRYLEAA